MCDLRVQPWRVGLHTICHRCEVDGLTAIWRAGTAPWVADEATLTHWFNQRQASEGVRQGLQQPHPWSERGWEGTHVE